MRVSDHLREECAFFLFLLAARSNFWIVRGGLGFEILIDSKSPVYRDHFR